MLNTKVTLFPGHIQSVYYQNILKILTFILTNIEKNDEEMKQIVSMTVDKMTVFLSSGDVEAQERVRFLSLIRFFPQSSPMFLSLGQCHFEYSKNSFKTH